MSILAICDAVAALLEPDPTMRDSAMAQPVEYAPDVLYVWPVSEVFAADGTGQLDEERFVLRVAWATSSAVEVASASRDRDITESILATADVYAAAVRDTRTDGATYEWLQVDAIDHTLVTHQVRGFLMALSGYQYRSI